MKTIGMIGGLSWESSVDYYRLVNEGVKARLGGLHSARCLLYSFDFAEIERLQQAGAWAEAALHMIGAARSLERAGADLLIICSNTMHKMAPEVEAAVNIPLLHIADATAERIKAAGLTRIGLLGTRYTMEQDFYKGRLIEAHGLDVITPDQAGRDLVHHVIYDELCLGQVEAASKAAYLHIIDDLAGQGAQAVILGCTEVGMLVQQADTPLPLFDTTRIHTQAVVEMALTHHETYT